MFRSLILMPTLYFLTFTSIASEQNDGQLGSWKKVIFRSDVLLNLHLFLYESARDEELFEVVKKDKRFSSEELSLFEAAVNAYQKLGASDNIHIIRSDGEIAALTEKLLKGDSAESELLQIGLFQHVKNVLPSTRTAV